VIGENIPPPFPVLLLFVLPIMLLIAIVKSRMSLLLALCSLDLDLKRYSKAHKDTQRPSTATHTRAPCDRRSQPETRNSASTGNTSDVYDIEYCYRSRSALSITSRYKEIQGDEPADTIANSDDAKWRWSRDVTMD
jgi:hypothetical protein